MYQNTGEKILTLANAIATITAAIFAVIAIAIGIMVGNAASGEAGLIVAVIICGVGIVLAWVFYLLLAGFGELVSNTHELLLIAQKHVSTSASTTRSETLPVVISSEKKATKLSETADPLIRRAFLSLEESDWDKANELFEQALNLEPENAKTYIGKLCCELYLKREEDLLDYEHSINRYNNYIRAVQFADVKYRKTLERYALTPEQRAEVESYEVEQTYKALMNIIDEARTQMQQDTGKYIGQCPVFKDPQECAAIISGLEQLDGYKDSKQILIELSTPVSEGDFLCCVVCGAHQLPNRKACFRCGIKFYYE